MITPAGDNRLRILVLGYLVRGPLGGLAWHHLQYVLGLHRLGHDVYFIEDSGDSPACYDPSRHVTDEDPSYGIRFTAAAFDRLGLGDRWAYFDAHAAQWLGPCAAQAVQLCKTADVILNVSAVNVIRPWMADVPVKALIDTDPAFTQIRHMTDTSAREQATRHTHFFTFGENFGKPGCSLPDDGFPWQPTRQPIVLDAWKVTLGKPDSRFTTVMQWDSYQSRDFDGRHYGMKAESFDAVIGIPRQTDKPLELAIGSANAPRQRLEHHGWHLRDPLQVTKDPWTYQQYIRDSFAEFSVAKHGYVASNSGWFSERSACYLASGRPVIVEDTGFGGWLTPGAGVLSFRDADSALQCIESVIAEYDKHCRVARQVAEECFAAPRVLGSMVEDLISISIKTSSG
jgi:hypothetical protein